MISPAAHSSSLNAGTAGDAAGSSRESYLMSTTVSQLIDGFKLDERRLAIARANVQGGKEFVASGRAAAMLTATAAEQREETLTRNSVRPSKGGWHHVAVFRTMHHRATMRASAKKLARAAKARARFHRSAAADRR